MMRTLVAMAIAAGAALITSLYLAQPAATWVTNQFTYDNPDTVGDLHAIVYMALNISALVIGYGIGWLLASPLSKTLEPH